LCLVHKPGAIITRVLLGDQFFAVTQ
jgi:hypothetical protein